MKDVHMYCNAIQATLYERESRGLIKCTGCLRAKMHMLLNMLMTNAK